MGKGNVSLVLDDAGYQANTAESGEQGIEKVKNSKYDLIFATCLL